MPSGETVVGRACILFDEFFKQFIAAGNRRIDPEAQRRNGIEILTEFFRFFRPIILQPTADEPVC